MLPVQAENGFFESFAATGEGEGARSVKINDVSRDWSENLVDSEYFARHLEVVVEAGPVGDGPLYEVGAITSRQMPTPVFSPFSPFSNCPGPSSPSNGVTVRRSRQNIQRAPAAYSLLLRLSFHLSNSP